MEWFGLFTEPPPEEPPEEPPVDRCSTVASVEVTTGKTLYTEGETVSGNFVLTNYTNASALVNFAGDLYENDVLVYTNSVDIMVYPGTNSFNLSDIFGSLSNYINAQGNYKVAKLRSLPRQLKQQGVYGVVWPP
jgi:hypothetical protein